MIAFLGDLHSNFNATTAVLEKIGELGCERIFLLGDCVGYSCHPNEVAGLCLKHKMEGVRGNHDDAVLSGRIDGLNEEAGRAALWTRRVLAPRAREYLETLPARREIDVEGRRWLLVHGSPRRPKSEYVYPDYPDHLLERFLGEFDLLAMGHTHIPFVKTMGEKGVFNPGSVGQPRDGDPRASFALIDREEIRIERIEYDIKAEADAILSCGLPQFLAERLYDGV